MASLMDAAQEIATKNKIEPMTNDFDETKSTASRVANIIDSGSPLMEQARTSGTQLAAARGLTNSSLAAQASQAAVIDKVTPIAQTDAQLSSTTDLANLSAKNAAATSNANNATSLAGQALGLENSNLQQDKTLQQQQKQFDVQAGQGQQQIDNQMQQFAQSLGMTAADLALRRDTLTTQQQQFYDNLVQQKQLATLQSDTQKWQSQLNADTSLKVAEIESSYKNDIQSSTNIAGAWSNTMQQIATIQNNPNLDQAAKETLIRNNIESFQSFAEFWKKNNPDNNTDITDLLNFNIVTTPTTGGGGTNNGGYYNGQYVNPNDPDGNGTGNAGGS